mmetsp:Transcript_19362/g.58520  ORF Transcript_19362/g.58520 Transcript_19362/m.58520 type:complete len:227 (-) Transcript_19362:200-880(-)
MAVTALCSGCAGTSYAGAASGSSVSTLDGTSTPLLAAVGQRNSPLRQLHCRKAPLAAGPAKRELLAAPSSRRGAERLGCSGGGRTSMRSGAGTTAAVTSSCANDGRCCSIRLGWLAWPLGPLVWSAMLMLWLKSTAWCLRRLTGSSVRAVRRVARGRPAPSTVNDDGTSGPSSPDGSSLLLSSLSVLRLGLWPVGRKSETDEAADSPPGDVPSFLCCAALPAGLTT